ncbi:MAG TPA: hypothetical protein VGH31_01305, partial [Acidimicrobiales bacterium]
LKADGAIGVNVFERAAIWGDHVIEFLAYGTAIITGSYSTHSGVPPMMVLLNDVGGGVEIQQRDTLRRIGPLPTKK